MKTFFFPCRLEMHMNAQPPTLTNRNRLTISQSNVAILCTDLSRSEEESGVLCFSDSVQPFRMLLAEKPGLAVLLQQQKASPQ